MENTKQNKLLTTYYNIKNSKTIENINRFTCSFWGIFTLACITFLTYLLAIEIVMYSLVCLYTIYICLFSKDFLPLVPLFVFCYIAPSYKNNPGRNAESIFYGATGRAIVIIAIICTIAILLRIAFDKNMSFKKLFTQRLYLTISMLILGGAYLVSGIFCDIYSTIWINNLVFALLQFLSIFLLYFILAATIDWKLASKDFLPYIAITAGFVICLQVIHLYMFHFRLDEFGNTTKDFIVTGWGISNNIAAMIVLTIPFAFYLACTKKNSALYLSIASFFMVGTILTLSRASFLVGIVIYIACWFICLFKAQNKKAFRITSIVIISLLLIFVAIFFKPIWEMCLRFLDIFRTDDNGNLAFDDANRFKTYKTGLEIFANYPIFGGSFFARNFWPYQYSTLESFTSFFPARWHNTIIQLLTSTGIVGFLAYAYHRVKTVLLIVKKPTLGKVFIGISILSFVGMSLLDCHMFNIGPVMFYSLMLIFAEKLYSAEPKQSTTENLKESSEKTKKITKSKAK